MWKYGPHPAVDCYMLLVTHLFHGIRGPLAMGQVVVPENMDMKDKFSLTQAALD